MKKILLLFVFLQIISFNYIYSQQKVWIKTSYPSSGFRLAKNPSNNDIYAGSYGGGLYKSTDNGQNWTDITSGVSSSYIDDIVISNSGTIFVSCATSAGGMFRSTNNGASWTRLAEPYANRGCESFFINPNNNYLFICFSVSPVEGIYVSTDNGSSWTRKVTGMSVDWGIYWAYAWTMKSSYIFVGDYNHKIYRTANNGDNWTQTGSGLPGNRVDCMATKSNGTIYAGLQNNNGVYYSTNDGNNWYSTNSGLTNLNINGLFVASNDDLYAGTNNGVFLQTNGQSSWASFSVGLPVSSGINRIISTADNELMCALGDGVYKTATITLNVTNISSNSVCQGGSITIDFTANGSFKAGNIFTAQLSNATASFASPTSIGTLTSTASGTIIGTIPAGTTPGTGYRIRVISSDPAVDGDDNGSDITINSLPNPSIIGPTIVCEDNKYFYSTSPPPSTTSEWFVTNGKFEDESTGNSVEVEWDSPPSGTITLVQTTTSNCVDSSYVVVTINPKADADITTTDTIICVGQTGLYLSNTEAGIIYKWVVNRGIIIGADDTPTLTVRWDTVGTGLVRLIHTFASTGCSDTTEINVIVSPLPQPQITTSDTVLCINSTGQYTSNTDASAVYQWIASGGIIQGVSDNSSVTVLWNTEGANRIKLIQTYPATGCKDSTEKTVSVNPLPITLIIGNANVLLNSTEQYSANTPAGISNLWSVNFGTIIGSTTDAVLSIKCESVGSGRVMLEQTNTNTSCINYDTLDITIYANIPPLTIDAGSDKEICKGESVQIGNPNAASGGVLPYRYIWTPAQGLSNDTIPNPIANPLQTTAYSLTVFDARDSIATDDVNVTVNPLPTPQIVGNTQVILDSTERYLADTPAGTTNQWSQQGGTSNSNPNGNSYDVRWDLQGSGKVILKQTIDATGCSASDTLVITIGTSIPSLSVEAGPEKSICQGDSVQIGSTNPASGGQPPYRFLWTPSQGLSNDTIPNPMASPQQSTVYILIVLDSKDSTATDSVNITVNPLPTPQIQGNKNVFLNSTVNYSANTPPGTENLWFVGNGSGELDATKDTFQITWNMLGIGRVILKQTITTTGCMDADTIDVNISATIPPLISDAGSDKEVCSGDTVQIGSINAASGGVEPYKYKWTPSQGLNNDTIPNPMASPLQSTVYSLTVIDALDSISTDDITVTVNPLPTPNIIGNDKAMRGTIVSYSVNIQAGTTNEWSVENGTQIGSGKGTTFQVRWDSAGTGKVIVGQTITTTGCHASDTLIITIDASQYAAVLDIPDMSAEPGEEITLPIYLRNAELLRNTNVTGFIADLKFNASLLEPIETTPIGTLSPDGKERIIPLRLGVTPSSDSTIQYLSFLATLGNDSTTVLRLENVSSIPPNVNIGSLPGTFTLTGICREGGARLVGYGPVVSVLINPNPVSSYCKIEYQTYKGYTKLYIINSFGETVKTLVDGELLAGWHTADFDLSNVPSGLYFVILQNESKRKVVMLNIVK
ncbi:MAG: hypothetical protein A2X61_05935 [Ignavibacteria bacterium GWB2_35_12]|nr:MAG: hypothetical protein A2X61_05935 [Ignavibacteria bacterium GWB2_35_12]